MQRWSNILSIVTTELERTGGGHGLDHTLRVTGLSRRIGEEEGADMEILIPAAMLHDITRHSEEETGIPHEIGGARFAEALLPSLSYAEDRIAGITHAIRAHRFSGSEVPATPEARILSDADKLDAMGAIGIARTCMTAGENKRDIHDIITHIREKLLILPDRMYTPHARAIAEKRRDFIEEFVTALILEEKEGTGDQHPDQGVSGETSTIITASPSSSLDPDAQIPQ